MKRIKTLLHHHTLLAFFICAYAVSWSLWFPVVSTRLGVQSTRQATLLLFLGGFGPFLAALFLTWVERGSDGVKRLLARLVQWRVSFSWYLVAFYGFPACGLLAVTLFTVASPSDALAELPTVLLALPLSTVTRFLVVGPLGEELGWRGYALSRLLANHSPLASSAALGLLWAFWHAPLMLVPEWRGSVTVGTFLVIYPLTLVALSAIFTWASLGTNWSLVVVMILHASYNATLFHLNDVFRVGRIDSWIAMGATAAMLWAIVLGLVLILGPDLRPRR